MKTKHSNIKAMKFMVATIITLLFAFIICVASINEGQFTWQEMFEWKLGIIITSTTTIFGIVIVHINYQLKNILKEQELNVLFIVSKIKNIPTLKEKYQNNYSKLHKYIDELDDAQTRLDELYQNNYDPDDKQVIDLEVTKDYLESEINRMGGAHNKSIDYSFIFDSLDKHYDKLQVTLNRLINDNSYKLNIDDYIIRNLILLTDIEYIDDLKSFNHEKTEKIDLSKILNFYNEPIKLEIKNIDRFCYDNQTISNFIFKNTNFTEGFFSEVKHFSPNVEFHGCSGEPKR